MVAQIRHRVINPVAGLRRDPLVAAAPEQIITDLKPLLIRVLLLPRRGIDIALFLDNIDIIRLYELFCKVSRVGLIDACLFRKFLSDSIRIDLMRAC